MSAFFRLLLRLFAAPMLGLPSVRVALQHLADNRFGSRVHAEVCISHEPLDGFGQVRDEAPAGGFIENRETTEHDETASPRLLDRIAVVDKNCLCPHLTGE